jgi:hypothetical protein
MAVQTTIMLRRKKARQNALGPRTEAINRAQRQHARYEAMFDQFDVNEARCEFWYSCSDKRQLTVRNHAGREAADERAQGAAAVHER